MQDAVFQGYLSGQWREVTEIAGRSDSFAIRPLDGVPPSKVIVEFRCNGLVKTRSGIEVADRHAVHMQFPDDYLRRSHESPEILSWLGPAAAYHTNIRAPFCCVGPIPPGMPLVNLIYQVYQMITWQRFTPREDDCLNPEACSWARANIDSFPVDPRRSVLRDSPAAGRPRGVAQR